MTFLSDRERPIVGAVAALATGNPFLPERIENERSALGERFRNVTAVWHEGADLERANPNVERVGALVEELAPTLRARLASGAKPSPGELEDYRGLIFYLLYYRSFSVFTKLIERGREGRSTTGRLDAYERYHADALHFLEIPGVGGTLAIEPSHLFAHGFQIRRAFEGTFRSIQGGSMPAATLRAAVWQSVFTHDSARYQRTLYRSMGDVTTLVLGESGTGKELVARAIGDARYIPFDEASRTFAEDFASSFHPVNLSALSPTLIESELFGHRRGSFTGALRDRVGWLDSCSDLGSVFLDEIGELDPAIQVKLLRVLQSRVFQRVGDTEERRFKGKLIAATNRDLSHEIERGGFREDLYYRLCADVIHTPTLREQIADSPGELPGLLSIITRRIVGEEEAPALAREVEAFVLRHLRPGYPWPGNVRELEQCVRNVLVRGHYSPADFHQSHGGQELAALLEEGLLSADELLRRYCTHVYAATGSYEEAGRRLGLDRRTVKAKLDPELLERIRA